MNNSKHGISFWIGNAVLVIAFICLFFMGVLSRALGIWAMVLWMALAAVGFYLIYQVKERPSSLD
ncbi:MAG: hypothetical protein WBX11_08920 [Thiobacillaceae bacterium]